MNRRKTIIIATLVAFASIHGTYACADGSLAECYPFSADGPTALDRAALRGELGLIRAYLSVDPLMREYTLCRLLYFSAIGLQVELAEYTIEEGADPFYRFKVGMDMYIKTPRDALVTCEGIDRASDSYSRVFALLEGAERAVQERSDRVASALADGNFEQVHAIALSGPLSMSIRNRMLAVALETENEQLLILAMDLYAQPTMELVLKLKNSDHDELTAIERTVEREYHENLIAMSWGILAVEANKTMLTRVNTLHEDKTPLMRACERCNAELVRFILELGADPTIENNDGQTAVDFVCRDAGGEDKSAILELLKRRRQ